MGGRRGRLKVVLLWGQKKPFSPSPLPLYSFRYQRDPPSPSFPWRNMAFSFWGRRREEEEEGKNIPVAKEQAQKKCQTKCSRRQKSSIIFFAAGKTRLVVRRPGFFTYRPIPELAIILREKFSGRGLHDWVVHLYTRNARQLSCLTVHCTRSKQNIWLWNRIQKRSKISFARICINIFGFTF